MIASGSCFCGHAKYSIVDFSGITLSAYCHCTRCQRAHSAPFIHTTHWKKDAVTWDDYEGTIRKWELVPGRKWKLRCAGACGAPMGSWNEAKQEWSLWPATISRDDPSALDKVKPFYGPWRAIDINDSLDKYEGYAGSSARV